MANGVDPDQKPSGLDLQCLQRVYPGSAAQGLMGSIVEKLRAPDKVFFVVVFFNHIVLIFFNFSMKTHVVGTL